MKILEQPSNEGLKKGRQEDPDLQQLRRDEKHIKEILIGGDIARVESLATQWRAFVDAKAALQDSSLNSL